MSLSNWKLMRRGNVSKIGLGRNQEVRRKIATEACRLLDTKRKK
jgi:hypothetical protein